MYPDWMRADITAIYALLCIIISIYIALAAWAFLL